MGDGPEACGIRHVDLHAVCGHAPLELRQRQGRVTEPEHHDVSLSGFRHDRYTRDFRQSPGQTASVRVILSQTIDHLLQGYDARRGQHARLAHAATNHLSHAPRPGDEGCAAGDQRAHRRSQPLGKTELDRIRLRGKVSHGQPQRDGRIKDASSVQVDRHTMSQGYLAHRCHLVH